MCIYDSPTEDREKAVIEKLFPIHEIVDPGTYNDNPEKDDRGMEYCFELVEQCDQLVFSRCLGEVTCGVGAEIERALSKGKAVFELVGNTAKPTREVPPYLSHDRTLELYAERRKRNVSYRF
jgi:hypothetical protein